MRKLKTQRRGWIVMVEDAAGPRKHMKCDNETAARRMVAAMNAHQIPDTLFWAEYWDERSVVNTEDAK